MAISVEGLKIATTALGCRLFIDLTEYPEDTSGNEVLEALIRL